MDGGALFSLRSMFDVPNAFVIVSKKKFLSFFKSFLEPGVPRDTYLLRTRPPSQYEPYRPPGPEDHDLRHALFPLHFQWHTFKTLQYGTSDE